MSVMFFGLAEMRIWMILLEIGVQLADGRFECGFTHDEAHSVLLSSVVAAKPEVMSFSCCRVATFYTVLS